MCWGNPKTGSEDRTKSLSYSVKAVSIIKSSRFAALLVILFAPFLSYAQNAEIRGKVTDARNGEDLTGASVYVTSAADGQNKGGDFAGLDATYNIKHLKAGEYTITAELMGYQSQQKKITITGAYQILTVNFALKPSVESLNEVTVKAKFTNGSDAQVKQIIRKSDNVVNALSAKSIDLLPDITTASILQRVSGVTMERSSTGQARYAVIRGMERRFSYTLVNGVKIPSPDNKYRYVPMDMFPSDLLERLEVHKSLTANMEGDAIGGAMNLVMKSAPDTFTFSANLGTGFRALLAQNGYKNFDKNVINQQSPADIHGQDYQATPNDFTYNNWDYKTRSLPLNTIGGFSIGDRFFHKKLGILVAGSYQDVFTGSKTVWCRPQNQPQPGNVPSFEDIYIRDYYSQQTRLGLHSNIDYVINKKSRITLYNMYMYTSEVQNRYTIDTSLSIGRSGTGTGNTYLLYRSMYTKQSIYNSTLHGEHELGKGFKLNWSAVYAMAKKDRPDWSEYQTVQVVGYDIEGKQTATDQVLNIPFYRIWTKNSDKNLTGYINLIYDKKLFNRDFTFEVGGLYRSRKRNNHYNEWDLIPKTSNIGQPIPFNGKLSPDQFQGFNGVSAAQGDPQNPLTYNATEKISAYYFQTTVKINTKLKGIAGIRVENTEQGWKTASDPTKSVGAIGTVPYSDVLPSMALKYMLNKKTNLRFSYYKALNRPGFFEYVPYLIVSDNWDLKGNPYLKHTTADNFDLRYEFFPKGLDQLLVGAFYKKIYNPIETSVVFTGTSSAALAPFNFGNATNYGMEFAFIKYFKYLGVSGNYTYTNSRITTNKFFYNENYVSEVTTQTRSLQGQSPHIANASLLYKNRKKGIDMQLTAVYTGTQITFVSPFKDLDYWQKSITRLSFSINKRISISKKSSKYLTVYCKVNNLLNAPVTVVIHQPNVYRTGKFALPDQVSNKYVVVQKDYYGQSFIFGIRFNNL